jgi:hypothetical protein
MGYDERVLKLPPGLDAGFLDLQMCIYKRGFSGCVSAAAALEQGRRSCRRHTAS